MGPISGTATFSNRNLNLSTNIGPAAEQLSLQQEAGQLLNQIERSHSVLDMLFSVGQTPATNAQSDMPNLASAINMARTRMGDLCERLEQMQRTIGQL